MQTILIVEDEKRVADLLKIGLEENGYQTMVAYDGAMGLRLFQSNSFQLVISDIILPKLDGFELCKEIRKVNERIPILMLTALGSADDKLEGFDAGADDYMVKTFDFRELNARVKVLLKRNAETVVRPPEPESARSNTKQYRYQTISERIQSTFIHAGECRESYYPRRDSRKGLEYPFRYRD